MFFRALPWHRCDFITASKWYFCHMTAAHKDKLHALSKLTFARVINGIVVWMSYHLSRWFKKPIHWGMPLSVAIEPTTACNLRCPECPSGLRSFTRETGNLQFPLLDKFLGEVSKKASYMTFYFQGEPYINPNFLEMVSKARDKGLYTSTSTNAHFLTPKKSKETVESGLDRLIISIDGTTQEVYQQYRKEGDLSKVLEGTRNIIAAKQELNSQTPHIIFQFLVVKPNEHQIDDVLRLGEEMGVDEVRFKTAQVYDYKNGNPLIPENEEYSRYRRKADGTFAVKNKLSNQCWRMWSSCVITWDGKVVPCCFDKDATHQLGDVSNETFSGIWRGAQYQSFRAAILKSRKEIDICANCSEGTKVWA